MDEETSRAISELVLSTRDLLQQGIEPKAIHDNFVENGFTSEAAWIVINESAKHVTTQSQIHRAGLSDERKSGLLMMLIGVGLFSLGGIVTAISYSATSPGGHYLVTTGLFLVGIWQFLKGLWRLIAG